MQGGGSFLASVLQQCRCLCRHSVYFLMYGRGENITDEEPRMLSDQGINKHGGCCKLTYVVLG